MKITQISNQHLLNRIVYVKRFVESYPGPETYMGNSDYAEDAVESENSHNEELLRQAIAHVKYMEKEAKKRGLALNSNTQTHI